MYLMGFEGGRPALFTSILVTELCLLISTDNQKECTYSNDYRDYGNNGEFYKVLSNAFEGPINTHFSFFTTPLEKPSIIIHPKIPHIFQVTGDFCDITKG